MSQIKVATCCDAKSDTFCFHCQELQCSACSKVIHSLPKRKHHQRISVTEFESKSKSDQNSKGFCSNHPKEQCVAYCEDCNEPVCLECLLNTHDAHKRKPLSETRDKMLQVFVKNQNLIKDSIKSYEAWSTKLTTDKVEKKGQIQIYFESLRKELNQKEQEMNTLIDTMHAENEELCQKDLKGLNELYGKMDNEINFLEQIKLNKTSQNHLNSLYDLEKVGHIVDGFKFTGNQELEKAIRDCANVSKLESPLTIMQRVKLSSKSRLEVPEGKYYRGQKIKAIVHLVDDEGNQLHCPATALKVHIIDKNNKEIAHQMTESTLCFVPTCEGDYSINVMVNGSKMDSSPFAVTVDEPTEATLKEFMIFNQHGEFKDLPSVVSLHDRDQWIGFKLEKKMVVQKYTIRSPSLRSWVFEGSNGGANWVTLKEHHHDFNWKDNVGTWDVSAADMFKMFRIRHIGKNAFGSNNLVLTSFEMFGLVEK